MDTHTARWNHFRRMLLAVWVCMVPSCGVAAPAADLWPFWEESDASSPVRLDHAPWQALLDGYLVTAPDGRTLFRYSAVTPRDRAMLEDYLRALTRIDPRTLARAEQLPYWINLYNAMTVRVVLDHPGEDSIRAMGGGWFGRGPWNDEIAVIAGQAITLNDIEHRILRPIWRDPRIHFVVNCASLGCPDLLPQAFARANTPELMANAEQRYLTHPRGLRIDGRGVLWLSSIFDWYRADFGGSRAELLAYLAARRPELEGTLSDYSGRIRFHYDWSLNTADPSTPPAE